MSNGLRKSDGIAFDDGMFEEPGVVVSGEVGAVVSAPTLFAGKRGASHEQGKGVEILRLMCAPSWGMGHSGGDLVELIERRLQSLSVPHDACIPPHQVLNLANDFFRGSANWSVGHGSMGTGSAGRRAAYFFTHSLASPGTENQTF